jgi:hypothetical protein
VCGVVPARTGGAFEASVENALPQHRQDRQSPAAPALSLAHYASQSESLMPWADTTVTELAITWIMVALLQVGHCLAGTFLGVIGDTGTLSHTVIRAMPGLAGGYEIQVSVAPGFELESRWDSGDLPSLFQQVSTASWLAHTAQSLTDSKSVIMIRDSEWFQENQIAKEIEISVARANLAKPFIWPLQPRDRCREKVLAWDIFVVWMVNHKIMCGLLQNYEWSITKRWVDSFKIMGGLWVVYYKNMSGISQKYE